VRPAECSAARRVAPFRIRHGTFLSRSAPLVSVAHKASAASRAKVGTPSISWFRPGSRPVPGSWTLPISRFSSQTRQAFPAGQF
jgi:hypothetical protein